MNQVSLENHSCSPRVRISAGWEMIGGEPEGQDSRTRRKREKSLSEADSPSLLVCMIKIGWESRDKEEKERRSQRKRRKLYSA